MHDLAVYSYRDRGAVPADAVYIGRPSPWGNPITIRDSGSRQACLEAYEHYLLERPELIAQIRRELKGKNLVCWCSPKPCHGDILLRIANDDSELSAEDATGF
jgi:hypothetical protein